MIFHQNNTNFPHSLAINGLDRNCVFFRFDSLFTAKRLFKARQGVKIEVAGIRRLSMTNEPSGFIPLS